jgi:hypothetical protein
MTDAYGERFTASDHVISTWSADMQNCGAGIGNGMGSRMTSGNGRSSTTDLTVHLHRHRFAAANRSPISPSGSAAR